MELDFFGWLVRLLAAAALAGVVGWQRETAHKPAGLRTHMLVGLGSALFTLAGIDAFEGSDPARVAAQVVSGIGFLGAGAIFREGVAVKGLTTAAGLWAVAAIGITAGAGAIGGAALATFLALIVLEVLGWVERRADRRQARDAVRIVVQFEATDDLPLALDLAHRIDPAAGPMDLRRRPHGITELVLRVAPAKVEAMKAVMMACRGVVSAEAD